MQQKERSRLAGESKRLYLIPVRDACNASCTFCYMDEKIPDGSRPQFIDLNSLKKVFSSLEGKFSEIEITGGGEPTLHPKIGAILSLANDSKAYTKMYTNGFSLIPLPLFDEVNISRVHWNSDINNRFYRSKNHNSLEEALNHYRPLVNRLRIQTVLLNGALDSQEKILEFVHRYDSLVDVFMFRTLFPKCSLEKDKFVAYPDISHPKVVFDKTLDTYDRPLFFVSSDCKVYDTFQF